MNVQIWRVLAQILFHRIDLIEVIKPFFDNLKNENINDEKYIPFLKTFSKDQLEILYQNGIITKEKFKLLIPKNQEENQEENEEENEEEDDENQSTTKKKSSTKRANFIGKANKTLLHIEEIISGDKINELQELIQSKDIKNFNTITKSFLEVEEMKIPIIQLCIIKKAIECFKYLLVNGYDDPKKTMEEQNPRTFYDPDIGQVKIKRYEWDCITTAIYFGNKEIIKILDEKGIEKGKNPTHIEAAILSYRNLIAKEIIEDLNENNEQIQKVLNLSLIASANYNNLQGAQFLITKGANNNIKDIIYPNLKILFLINII